MGSKLKLTIPKKLSDKYNNALFELEPGKNTFVGNRDKLEMLEVGINNPATPNVMILGEQGVGKTALVEQWLYEKQKHQKKALVMGVAIETLGELGENIVISRMKSLLSDVEEIEQYTKENYPESDFDIIVFIDEVHKLNSFGYINGSSGAMNALKEGTARGQGKIITATTDYEYRKNIAPDPAFDRRFLKVIMEEPSLEDTIKILKRKMKFFLDKDEKLPGRFQQSFFTELVQYCNSFIRNQVNPAKSLSILSSTVGYVITKLQQGEEAWFNHEALAFVFKSEGYNIDSPTTAKKVKEIVQEGIKGQPLAIKAVTDIINASFYTKRNLNRPLLTMFSIGTTGTGKSETAKLLALAFFKRKDAIIVLNGGDFKGKEDGIKAQKFIGDKVAVNKQLVILLDEIEKADPNVLDSYMRMIDDGIVRDSLNIERSINNTIIVATSNLASDIFSDMASTMRLDTLKDPNKLTRKIEEEWYKQESAVREAVQKGDKGRNNGLKPEFLERFTLFVPYLPLPKIILAGIARQQLLDFQMEMSEKGYEIQLLAEKDEEEWQKLLPNTKYVDIDPVSVMISEDIVNSKASTAGARTITRFINTSVKPKVANAIAYRVENELSLDGAFQINTNGMAIFESKKKGKPDVKVVFVDRSEMNNVKRD